MDVEDIQKKMDKFVSEREWDDYHTPKNLAIALSVEASELLEHFQWRDNESSNEVRGNDPLMNKIKEEIADVLIYLTRLSTILQIDLTDAVNEKLILNERKYPVSLSKGKFVKYSDRDE
ncbi:MAG: nucleotide pyrophosphohydrolase [Spirochaetia bacterium]|nr:nucleotide pyrophosphohydrolase [Spirochaetia bacterium]